MKYEIIFFFPFIFSLVGLQRIINQKMKNFSQIEAENLELYIFKKLNLWFKNLKTKIQNLIFFVNDSFLLFLQKNLKKISFFLLFLYNKIGSLNQKIISCWKKNCFQKKDEKNKPV